jgi:PTS system nitrogen regulatory IIA component
MAQAVLEREEMHPTALENGVALLHPRRPQPQLLAEPFFALGRVDRGIPFGGSRGVLTDVFFLICSHDDHSHLRNLARLSRMIADEEFLPALRAVTEPRAARDIIGDWERRISPGVGAKQTSRTRYPANRWTNQNRP